MKPTTKAKILSMAAEGFTFYAPVGNALKIKYSTAEKYLKQLVKEGLLVQRDDRIHAVTFELSSEGKKAKEWDELSIS